jgi:hypothetical protein
VLRIVLLLFFLIQQRIKVHATTGLLWCGVLAFLLLVIKFHRLLLLHRLFRLLLVLWFLEVYVDIKEIVGPLLLLLRISLGKFFPFVIFEGLLFMMGGLLFEVQQVAGIFVI